MRHKWQRFVGLGAFAIFGALTSSMMLSGVRVEPSALAQTSPSPTPAAGFDQAAAIAKLREQIKGRETETADKVFKNIQMLKTVPAGRLLAMMEMGFSRSLGVNCTHCHAPDKWEAEDKP